MAIETDSSCHDSLHELGVELVGTSGNTNNNEVCNLVHLRNPPPVAVVMYLRLYRKL